MASFRAVALLLSCLLASLLSFAEGHRWRGHGRLAKKSRPHKRPGVKITIRRKSHKRKHFKSRKPKCAKHLRICAGRLRTSKKACCQRKGDECRRFGKHISICFPKPRKPEPVVLLPDGEECVTAEECVNECISLECQEEANGGVCPGECAALPTVEFEPDQDVDDNSVARLPCNELGTSCDNGGDCCGRTQCQLAPGCNPDNLNDVCESTCVDPGPCVENGEACDDSTNCCGQCDGEVCNDPPPQPRFRRARARRCPGSSRGNGQLCWRRNGLRRRCRGGLRCVWGRRRIRGFGTQWVGVCRRSRSRPIFNC